MSLFTWLFTKKKKPVIPPSYPRPVIPRGIAGHSLSNATTEDYIPYQTQQSDTGFNPLAGLSEVSNYSNAPDNSSDFGGFGGGDSGGGGATGSWESDSSSSGSYDSGSSDSAIIMR